jgi:hypothetical protein
MDTMDRNLGCGMVDAWEERIWLDRREVARCPPRRAGFAAISAWWRRFAARTQLGPVAGSNGWADSDPDKRF